MVDALKDPLIHDFHRHNRHSGGLFTKTSRHDTYDFICPAQFDLSGRTALITGASKGIGRTMAVSYAQARISGICLAARSDMSSTISAIQGVAHEFGLPVPKIVALTVDVTDQASVEAGAKKFSEEFPEGLDILISNAGYLEPEKPVSESDPVEWWKSMEINLKGPYLVARSFIPFLMQKPNGLKVLCNTVSIGAHMLFPGMSAYNTAKLAVCRLTEYEDVEYADQGLISFSIHPGGVPTDMAFKLPKEKQVMLTETHELVSDTTVWLTAQRREWLKARYVSVQWDMQELEEHSKEVVEQDLLKVKLMVGNGFLK
ncbi:short chain dehydrogenase reductase [Rhizodiscina lignyota]|uniref:Short chain dehydrogenase reductase n=1 Tax=Rhizodiscina lignyota TaxID=1504668 RepID=A0A9P4I5W9_9PEZI|nr:short chain dehydrogenase reductase [Rhizodiscina lignyota]